MDMDPITRREADKIEFVLQDLVKDLELISFLPGEFSFWLRDGLIPEVSRFEASQPSRKGGIAAAAAHDDLSQLCKAAAFVHAASHYGDPADCSNNRLFKTVSDLAGMERELLETASKLGTVELEDLQAQRWGVLALLDDLRGGGYEASFKAHLRELCPPPQERPGGSKKRTSKSEGDLFSFSQVNPEGGVLSSVGTRTIASEVSLANSCENSLVGVGEGEEASFAHHDACARGMLHEDVDHLRYVVHALLQLMRLRNSFTVNEDVHRYNILHEAVNREQSAVADVQAFNQAYKEIRESRKREVAELDDEIQQLEEELAELQRSADAEFRAFNEMSSQMRSAQRGNYRRQLESHVQAATALEQALKQVEKQHTDEMAQLRSVKAKSEAAVSGAIVEFDTGMHIARSNTRRLEKEAEEDTARIVAMDEQLQRLKVERSEHEWELHVAEQRLEHETAIQQRQAQQTRIIQAYYRAYAARRQFEKEVEAKNKKKRGRKKSERG